MEESCHTNERVVGNCTRTARGHARTHTHTLARTHLHTYAHTHTHTRTHTHRRCKRTARTTTPAFESLVRFYMCVCLSVSVCVSVCLFLCVCLSVCFFVCVCLSVSCLLCICFCVIVFECVLLHWPQHWHLNDWYVFMCVSVSNFVSVSMFVTVLPTTSAF